MRNRRRRESLQSQNSGYDRPEPRLLRAVEANDVNEVRIVIEEAAAAGKCSTSMLSVGLTRACDKNFDGVAHFLLQRGADPNYVSGNKLPCLIRAAENGHLRLAELLIEFKADVETYDKRKRRTALMTAAWKGQLPIVELLLSKGANINTVDFRRRNVLHNVTADKAGTKGGQAVVDTLLNAGIDIEARDENGRTALHWCCVTGKDLIARSLIARSADLEALDSRLKTPLHFAAWNGHLDLTRMLLDHGTNISARSDGGWTALHYAASRASHTVLDLLIEANADINSELLNGRTPLHTAAENGNTAAVVSLLKQPHIRRIVKDRFGNTPLLIAAQHGKKDIVELMAPWNYADLLSEDEIEASLRFEATIVDFGNFRNENKVSHRSVFDLLYTNNGASTVPKNIKATKLRWIHLPANNIAWCEALITKRFIEEGAVDIEGYKAVEASFSHQHRGRKQHSRFMRPVCAVVQRQVESEDLTASTIVEEPANIVDEPMDEPTAIDTSSEPLESSAVPPSSDGSGAQTSQGDTGPHTKTAERRILPSQSGSSSIALTKGSGAKTSKDEAGPSNPARGARPASGKARNDGTPSTDNRGKKKGGTREKEGLKQVPQRKQGKGGPGNPTLTSVRRNNGPPCSMYMFMPYLHFETDEHRKQMQAAIEQVSTQCRGQPLHEDELLIRAHLTASTSFLHVRRTLDQFFYHNIDTQTRDCDQVVWRYQVQNRDNSALDPKILMVDQLWMWVIGRDLVITSFPRRWKQPRNDPLNVLDGIIEDINSKTREPIANVYELATTIAGRCYGSFDRKGGEEFQFFDMFESSLGAAMDREAALFRKFTTASRQASEWLQNHERSSRFSQPIFIDRMLDVGAETDLLAEVKDIREELNIIRMVLEHQESLALDLRKAIKNIYEQERSHIQLRKIEKVFDEQDKTISNPIKDLKRMSDQADRIYDSITELFDLKQKHANAFEARFARDQAAGTIRQGRTVLVFTVVTVIFLPISFVAAFFAINLEDWPNPLTISYVSEYIFGIGLAISIPCIIVALTVDELGAFFSWLKRNAHEWFGKIAHPPAVAETDGESYLAAVGERSMIRSARRSMDTNWLEKPIEPRRGDMGSPWQEAYGRKRQARISWDVERGRNLSRS